jgi:hypothetical protein
MDLISRSRILHVVFTVMLAAAIGCGSSNTTGGAGSGGGTTGTGGTGGGVNANLAKFSFFVVSLEAVRALSGSQDGFGGDLRYGETGDGAGLRGADKICAATAEMGIAGAGTKTWHAFLSSTSGATAGGAVNAKDRIGAGPWYDARGRQVASTLAQLLMDRPGDADPAIKNDLPNEFGIPNHMDGAPGCTGSACPNNHQILTGTGADGALFATLTPVTDSTCGDWTSKEAAGRPRSGHSWPRTGSGTNWISAYDGDGCAPCAMPTTTPDAAAPHCVGSTGGYGGFYCFAINN